MTRQHIIAHPDAFTTDADWCNARRTGIGGSDAPALVLPPEIYRWRRPKAVYSAKVNGDDSPAGLAAEVGTYLEDFVARKFSALTGIAVQKYNFTVRSDSCPWMIANIDRKVIGRREGLECKTTSAYNDKRFTDDEYPYEYYVQIQHYLAVTGWEQWYLAVLVGNNKFKVYTVERNEDDIKHITDTERRFWDIVETKNTEELELWA